RQPTGCLITSSQPVPPPNGLLTAWIRIECQPGSSRNEPLLYVWSRHAPEGQKTYGTSSQDGSVATFDVLKIANPRSKTRKESPRHRPSVTRSNTGSLL